MSLSFLSSQFLYFLPLALAPLLLHFFYRKKPKVLDYPETMFIELAIKKTSSGIRLRQLLLLAARTLILLFIILFFSKPVFQGNHHNAANPGKDTANKSSSIIFLIDVSFSTDYDEGGRTRLEKNIDACRRMLSLISVKDRAGIIVFSNRIEKATPGLVNDRGYLDKFLSDIKPTNRSTDIEPALALSKQLFGQSYESRRVLVLLSDTAKHVFSHGKGMGEGGYEVLYFRYPDKGNVWIKNMRSRYDDSRSQWYFEGEYACDEQMRSRYPGWTAAYFLDNNRVGDEIVQFKKNETVTSGFSAKADQRQLGVRIELSKDRLSRDNARSIVAEEPRPYRTWIIDGSPRFGGLTAESYFLKLALPQATVITEEEADTARFVPPGVIILANLRKDHESISNFIRSGGGALVFPGDQYSDEFRGDYLPCSVGLKFEKQTPVQWSIDTAQALNNELQLSQFDTTGITLSQGYYLQPKRNTQILASLSDNTPFITQWEYNEGKVVMFASSPTRQWGNLVSRPLFVPLVRALCDSAAGVNAAKYPLMINVGQVFKYKSFDGIKVVSPSGKALSFENIGGEFAVADTEETGIYNVYSYGERKVSFAVNIEPGTDESDLTPASDADLEKCFPGSKLVELDIEGWEKTFISILSGKEFSKLILLLLLLLVIAEIWLANPKYKK